MLHTIHKKAKVFTNSSVYFVCFFVCFSLSVAYSQKTKEKISKPNFIIIFTDDQGYADLSCFGGTHVNTPEIDKMAAEGAKLTSFYVAAPFCTPSRAALMTGSYPKRIGMAKRVLLAADSLGLNPNEVTIAEVLKSAGYKTGMFGKWHLGDQPEFLPTKQGFDEFFGIPYSHDIHPFHGNQKKFNFPSLPLLDGETVVELDPDADYLIKRITERTLSFIEQHKDEPFFVYMPHTSPHRPMLASPEFMKNAPEDVKAILKNEGESVDYKTRDKIYPQTIAEIDWSVGQILEALRTNGLDENTFVIFTSDNGPMVGSAAPLKGKKGSTFEGGMRMPTVVWWPGKIPAGSVTNELLTAMDLLPTFTKLASAEMPTDRVLDGKDVFSVLQGKSKSPHEVFYYYNKNILQAVRSGKWKLRIAGKESPALYNLEDDISETKNIIAAHPDIETRLRSAATEFENKLKINIRPAGVVKNPKPLSK
ncbi:arylsulfatase A-like enzyme [Jejuia pallidilutea]|uniref:Arylsulfatase A-like enzyme n=1 Tax=Jejuia pallidilutea TaxID=504487 RepID=A0A362X6I1_9FLAO|nr:sulfatase [Jejuia pallidilutea]PQV50621.1 arylsulfatase A-like enzyme [Jejuia pallidilutea]